MVPEQDCILWKLFITGNKPAFESLMSRHFKHLFYYGSKFSADEELVKDTIQELFIRLWDKRSSISTDVNPKAYLTASLRRALHRKIQSESKFVSYAELEDSINYFDMQVSVEDTVIAEEHVRNLSNHMAENINNLPCRQKEVVYLKFFEELSRDEIAEAMQISPQTVSNLLQMALKRLKSEIVRSKVLVCFTLFGKF